MTHPPQELLCAYAQGDLDLTKSLLIEAHLALCPRCRSLVAARRDARPGAETGGLSEDVEMGLGDAGLGAEGIGDEVQVPPFERVWRAVQQATDRQRVPGASAVPPGVLTALPDPARWRWRRVWPARVTYAVLARDPRTGSVLYLSYYRPRSTFPRHRHLGLEENVILAGGYQNGDVHVEAGDWVVGAPGTEHAPTTGPDEDCTCLSRIERPGLRFTAWRRWVVSILRGVSKVRRRFAISRRSEPITTARARRASRRG